MDELATGASEIPVNHQGDWEHATAVVKNGSLIGAYLAAHGHATFYGQSALELGEDDRFVVYIARGSHAAYPSPGPHRIVHLPIVEYPAAAIASDHTDGGGVQ